MRKLLLILLVSILLVSICLADTVDKPLLGRQINWAHPLARGLVGHLVMNENSGSKIFDLSGNGNHGTFNGDVSWVIGKFGSALDFDGSGDYVSFGPISMEEPFSFVMWIKADDVSGWNDLVCPAEDYGAHIIDGRLRWYGAPDTYTEEGFIVVNKWYQVAFVCEEDETMTIYANGIPAPLQSAGSGPVDSKDYQRIGHYNESFDGQFDHLYIYNRALNASEIAQLYRERFCMFKPSWSWVLYGAISAPPAAGGQVIYINLN